MKMEVLPVQSQFQGQFGVMGSSKIKGKQHEQISRFAIQYLFTVIFRYTYFPFGTLLSLIRSRFKSEAFFSFSQTCFQMRWRLLSHGKTKKKVLVTWNVQLSHTIKLAKWFGFFYRPKHFFFFLSSHFFFTLLRLFLPEAKNRQFLPNIKCCCTQKKVHTNVYPFARMSETVAKILVVYSVCLLSFQWQKSMRIIFFLWCFVSLVLLLVRVSTCNERETLHQTEKKYESFRLVDWCKENSRLIFI